MLTTAYDSSIWQVGERWWLLELNVQRLCRQYFSTLQMVGGLRAVGVGSSSELAEAPQPRFSCTAMQALLRAGGGSCPTLSRPHAGCTQGIHMVGSFGVAYSAL